MELFPDRSFFSPLFQCSPDCTDHGRRAEHGKLPIYAYLLEICNMNEIVLKSIDVYILENMNDLFV